MNPEQKSLVKASWNAVLPVADQAAALFYDRLFELDPGLRRLFARTDMTAQRAVLMRAIGGVVAGLDDLGRVVPALQSLGRRHAGYGVRDRHYDTVGAALLWTLERGLGEAWTAPVAEAWTTAYTLVAGVMREAAQEADTIVHAA